MRVGDLVKFRCPTTKQVGKVFLVTMLRGVWIRILGYDSWKRIADLEVVSESR